MTKGQSGTKVLLKTIYNEAMTQMTGTAMYMSPEQFRFTYSYPGKSSNIFFMYDFFVRFKNKTLTTRFFSLFFFLSIS